MFSRKVLPDMVKEEIAKKIVAKYIIEHLDKSDNIKELTFDVYIVWSCYILRNYKMLLSSTLNDGMYYEVTYNVNTQEFYLDAYKKFENKCVAEEALEEFLYA